jgi:EAL domain-containing protein (putative c-di-GMP-specific phosphodiesterase class I)
MMITERTIRAGLNRNQFLFHYQPKVSLVTGVVTGAEALIRWKKPDGSMVHPYAFIPVAERSPLIKEITGHMFSRLVADLASLRNSVREVVPISFNASARDFEDTGLVRRITDTVEKQEIAPGVIEIEITETEALAGGEAMMRNMSTLREAGVAFTMDDYGTGYSTIDTLSKWPFTTIKLDQGLIGRMLESSKNATIVRSSIRLGHELDINVIAEGVETMEQCQFLLEAGCKIVQGYLISRPLPLEQFAAFHFENALSTEPPIGLVHMAIMDHVQWRSQMVRHILRCTQLPPKDPLRLGEGYPELSLNKCFLGRWYFGEGMAFADKESFHAIDVPHRELHKIGSKLVEQVHAGAELHEVAPLLHDLRECSRVLLGLLQALEEGVIAERYRPR